MWKKRLPFKTLTNNFQKLELIMNQIGFYRDENDDLNVQGIKIVYLDETDVIRHQVVKRIIKAYEKNTEKK